MNSSHTIIIKKVVCFCKISEQIKNDSCKECYKQYVKSIKDYETCYKVSIIIIIVCIERQTLAYTFQNNQTTLLTMISQKSSI